MPGSEEDADGSIMVIGIHQSEEDAEPISSLAMTESVGKGDWDN